MDTAAPATLSGRLAAMPPEDQKRFWLQHSYLAKLPDDIAPMRQLLAEYSRIPPDEVDALLFELRDKAWAVHKYPCVGRFSFLDLGVTQTPYVQEARARLVAAGPFDASSPNNERLLDLGCCVGQVLRQLAHSGVDPRRLAGADLHRAFIDLGYDLFRDSPDTAPFTFAVGDLLDDGEAGRAYDTLVGGFTMVHAANFFHLFTWDQQVKAAVRIVGFLGERDNSSAEKNGRLRIFGVQLAHRVAGDYAIVPGSPAKRFLHDAASFRRLWDEVGARTGRQWRTAVTAQRDGVGAALAGNPDVMYVRYGVWEGGADSQ